MKSIWQTALNYLTRREHSALELSQKLAAKGYQNDEINQTLIALQLKKLQSDKRFSEAFVRMRVSRGKGRLLINQELKSLGITNPDFSAFDFCELARKARIKKFGINPPKTPKEKAKQMRFLQQRGFAFKHIEHVFKHQ